MRWATFAFVFAVFSACGSGFAQSAPADAADAPAAAKLEGLDGPAGGTASRPTPRQIFREHDTTLVNRLQSFLGIPFFIAIAWLLSNNRRRFPWRIALWGVGLQVAIATIVLEPNIAQFFFKHVDGGIRRLLSFVEAGIDFTFQSIEPHKIVHSPKGDFVFRESVIVGRMSPPLKTLAFWVLPTIIFFSSLMTLAYHLGIMQRIVGFFARIMQRTMGTSGAETLSAAANIFVGQTEAPLMIRPFIARMTKSEIMAVMTAGFATVAGGIMALYVSVLRDIPGIGGHLMIASMMSAPAALAVAKIMFPETEKSHTAGTIDIAIERPDANAIEAIARGASEGLMLTLNVGAMLIAFVAMVAAVNYFLGFVGTDIQTLLGWINAPFAFMMGVPWEESMVVGRLLGEKVVLTEVVAYINLGTLLGSGDAVLSERSAIIASYGLCGFSNLASIGIQIGGIGPMAPERRGDLARLGVRAMIGGLLAACMTGTIAGIMLG